MPDQTVPTPQYADDMIQFGVDIAEYDFNEEGAVIRIRLFGAGFAASYDLTPVGAQRISTLIDNAVVTAISRGSNPTGR